jgi:ferritin-like metal-binding protein YciE
LNIQNISMSENPNESRSGQKINLGSKKLKIFFINHLDKIYAAKSHLVSRLPLIANEVHFSDLRYAINETVDDVEKQMARMELIYTLLDAETNKGNSSGLVGLVDDAFEDIKLHRSEHELRDLSIAFYMHNIESMEMASFQILQMAAVKLKNKQVKQLLKENYDEAKADRSLVLLIASKYVTSGSN